MVAFTALACVPTPGIAVAVALTLTGIVVGARPRGLSHGLWVLSAVVAVGVARVVLDPTHTVAGATDLPSALLRAGIPWLIAVAWRTNRTANLEADARIVAQRRHRDAAVRRERDAERIALAEELHDRLGHTLSLAALRLGRLELDDTLSSRARRSVSEVRGDLASAVEQLGDSVVSLRTGAHQSCALSSSPVAAVERARDAGLTVELGPLPPAETLARINPELLERVMRELVTNAGKHAPDTALRITVTGLDSGLAVQASNRLPTRRLAPATSRTGLTTLDRVLRARGGSLRAGPEGDEFTVEALIPASETESDSQSGAAAEHAGDDDLRWARRRRRRGNWAIAAAVLVVVTGLGVVQAVSAVANRRALLPEDQFERIHVGMSREDTRELLPEHELPNPREQEGCHDYAATARAFDDELGDVYQICFDGERVSSATRIRSEER